MSSLLSIPHRGIRPHRARGLRCELPNKMSKEHAIPQWVARDLGVVRVNPMIKGSGIVVRPMNGVDVLVNRVCKPCNEGWMQRLEASFATTVPGILTGQGIPITLQPADQEMLGLWATKTGYMLTAGTSFATGGAVVPPAHLATLYRARRPPPNTTVMLGAVDAQGSLISWTKPTTFTDETGFVGYDIPFSVGHALFIVRHWSSSKTYLVRPELAARLLTIWPASADSVVWPPLPPFTEAELASIWQ